MRFAKQLSAILVVAFLSLGMMGGNASAFGLKITKPELSGPVRLVCLTPDGLTEHVQRLTRNQLIGVRAAAHVGAIKYPCDDVQLPVGTEVIHTRWLQTSDKWWVLAETLRYPNRFITVSVDPGRAQYRVKPPEFKLRFVITPQGVWEIVE